MCDIRTNKNVILFQICSVCKQKYDIVYNLDEGLEHIKEIIEKAGSKIKNSTATDSKMKVVGPKIQRKFFSEVTADEIELLYNKFRDDFLLFGYSLDFYKNKGWLQLNLTHLCSL